MIAVRELRTTRKRALALLLPLLWLAVAEPGHAVVMIPASIGDLAQKAEIILHGTVVSQTCQRDPEGRIFTRIELNIHDVWKGRVKRNPFLIVHGGGILGEEQSAVSGQETFHLGEEVVAFLVLNQRGEGVTIGLAQGKFHVWEENGVKRARNIFHGHPSPAGPNSRLSGIAHPRFKAGLTLAQLRNEVRAATR